VDCLLYIDFDAAVPVCDSDLIPTKSGGSLQVLVGGGDRAIHRGAFMDFISKEIDAHYRETKEADYLSRVEAEPSLRGASAHLLAVAVRPD